MKQRTKMAFDKTYIDQLLQEGWTSRIHDVSKSRELTQQALEMARAYDYTLGIIRGLRNLAAVQDENDNYTESLTLILEALDMLSMVEEAETSSTDAFDLYLLAASRYLRLGDLHQSLVYCYKAENIAVNLSDQTRRASVYKTIGNTYFMVQKYPEAISYLTQAREILQEIGDVAGEIAILNNLCHFCHNSGDLGNALAYGNLGLELSHQMATSGDQQRRLYGYILNNIGVTYIKSKRFDEAAPFFHKALTVFEQDLGAYGAIYSWRGLGKVNLHNKKFTHALRQLKTALKLAEQSNIKIEQKTTHHALVEAYKKIGNPELALAHFEQFYALDKQLFDDEKEKNIRNLEAAHRIQQAQNEAQIAELKTVKLQNEINKHKKNEEELWSRAAELEGLRDMGLELASKLELNALLDAIVIKAIELLKGDSGFLSLHRPEEDDLEIIIGRGPINIEVGTYIKRGEGLSGKVWQDGKSRIQKDYWNWAGRITDKENADHVTIVAVPIQWGDEFLGILNVAAHNPDAHFTEDPELLELFAIQAAVAINNAQLHKQIHTYADEMEQRVTERTQELTVANKRLLELDMLKSQLIGNVSHELRTPVTTIGLYIDLLERSPAEKQQHYLNIIRSQKNRLAKLIEGILTISHLHNTTPQFAPAEINQIVAQVLENQRNQAQNKNISLIFTPLAPLPLIQADAKHLTTAIANLCDNAIKYTESGSVSISTHIQKEKVCIKISDTGIGIADSDIPYLFDHFYRGEQVAQLNIPGIGLGLTIAKEIVAFHDGEIIVENMLDQGTTFKLYLPV